MTATFLSVVLAVAWLFLSVDCCTDMDEVIMDVTQHQMGQPLSCAQVVSETVCLDPHISQEICCFSCGQLRADYLESRDRVLDELEVRVGSVQALFGGSGNGNERFRSPPLHGRGEGMPLIALGTGGLQGEKGADVLAFALKLGYRHLDSAIMYSNHGEVFRAVEMSKVPRAEIFITSKIPPNMMGFGLASKAVEQIKSELPGNYADLCLIHWPHVEAHDETLPHTGELTLEWTIIERAGTWRALEDAFVAGTCRAIGTSNFMVKHLEELNRYAKIAPSVNQLEYSPLAPLKELVSYCKRHRIVLQAFGWHRPEVLDDSTVLDVAAEVARPPAQVVAMWLLQQGHVPLYMSSKFDRVLQYAEALLHSPELSDSQLDSIGKQRWSNYPWRYYKGELDARNIAVMADVVDSQRLASI